MFTGRILKECVTVLPMELMSPETNPPLAPNFLEGLVLDGLRKTTLIVSYDKVEADEARWPESPLQCLT